MGVTALDIVEKLSEPQVAARRLQIKAAYDANLVEPNNPNSVYLDEAYYFVPIELALRLLTSGEYIAALDWLSSVYDYGRPVAERKIAYNLVQRNHSMSSSSTRQTG